MAYPDRPIRPGHAGRSSRRPGRRRARRRRYVGAIALAAGLVVAGCSPGAPSRAELVEALRTSGLSEGDAGCVADAVLGELSEDEVALIADRGPSGAPFDDPDTDDDAIDRVRAAIAECAVAPEPLPEPDLPTVEPDAGQEGVEEGDGVAEGDGAVGG